MELLKALRRGYRGQPYTRGETRDSSYTVIAVREPNSAAATSDVVFAFSLETLDDAIRRHFHRPPDQMVLALARDSRVGELLVADPWRSYASAISRRAGFHLVEPFTVAGREAVRVRPRRLARFDSSSLSRVERSYHRYGLILGRALARVRGVRTPEPRSASLVTYHPFVAAFCDAPWISRVIYVGRDDWTTDQRLDKWADVFRLAYQRMDERGADLFAVSQELAGRISPRTEVLPNGVISEVWRPRHPAADTVASLPRPRAVYTGTMNRFDRELVETTSRSVGSLVLIGPCDAQTQEWLRTMDNVHYFPTVGQVTLASMVQACDVGVIPHVDNAFTRAMSPLKLYEYLAAGLPVVSVDLPPIHGVDDDRVLIRGMETWADGLAEALEMGPASEDYRQHFTDEASWEKRLRTVIDIAVNPDK